VGKEVITTGIVQKNLAPPDASGNDMMQGAGSIDS